MDHLSRKIAYDSLCSGKLKLIDNDCWEFKPYPDRLEKSVKTYTAVGQVICKLCGIVIVIPFFIYKLTLYLLFLPLNFFSNHNLKHKFTVQRAIL